MARTRRVAITLEQCWHRVPGGTATAALATVRALQARDDVDLVAVTAFHRRPPVPAFALPADLAVRALPLPRRALYEAWHGLRWPAVQRATGAVDVVHATGVALPPKKGPLVTTVHDLAFLADAGHATKHGHRFFRRALALALRDADLVLCSSHATVAECRAAGFAEERLRLVPLGHDGAPAADADRARVRRTYALDRPYVLFVGTAEPRKNLGGVVEGFAGLGDADVDLVLVGPDGWNEDLDARLVALGRRARRLGFVPSADLPALHAEAMVLCYPSFREGFGLPVLDAMAQGTPVVVADGTAPAELAGEAGLAVDPHDTGSITAALAKVLGDPALAGELGTAGRARASGFTWERTAALTAAAYAEVSP